MSPTVILVIFLLAGWSWPAGTNAPVSDFLNEYPIPAEDGRPLNIITEAPRHVWFTMPTANAIGSLIVTSTIDYRFDQYAVPTPNSTPYDLVYDHARNILWFTEHEANKIAYLEPVSGHFTEYPIPTTGSAPAGIAISPDGNVWFVEQDSNQLARFDPDSKNFSEFPYPPVKCGQDADLEDIAVAHANSIWITAPGAKQVTRYIPSSEHFLCIPVSSGPGTPSFAAFNIAIGNGGYPWVTAPDQDRIGLFVPGTTSLWRWYNLPGTDPIIAGLAYSWDGARHHLWFTDSGAGHVGLLVIDVTGKVVATRRHGLSSANSVPIGIAVDANQHVWIAEYGSKMIAHWYPPYSHGIFLPLLYK